MFGSFHIAVDAILIVGASIALSMLVLWLIRAAISHERLRPHNDVSGFVYAAIGVIYAVILGLAVISVWEEFRDAEANALAEANSLGTLYRIGGGLPDPARQSLQRSINNYATFVLREEWPAMNRDDTLKTHTAAPLDAMWTTIYEIDVSNPTEEVLYAAALEQMDNLSQYRQQRIEDTDTGLLGIMWLVMIGGAALTVLFPCLFGVENGLVHSLIVGTLAATLGLLLLLAYDLNHPFRGDVRVQPDGFTQIMEQFGRP